MGALKGLGARIEAGPADFPDWGIRAAYLRDPDGNLIEVNAPLTPDERSDNLKRSTERWDRSEA